MPSLRVSGIASGHHTRTFEIRGMHLASRGRRQVGCSTLRSSFAKTQGKTQMTHDPRNQAQVLEQERRRLSQRLDEVARLCEAPIPPSSFYAELLQRLLESLAAPGGCVWVRTAQGNLQQAFHTNFQQAGLD